MHSEVGLAHVSLVGLNHRSAPLEVRERVAVGQTAIHGALENLAGVAGLHEAVILSTCNRTEVVATGPSASEAEAAAVEFFRSRVKDSISIDPHLYRLQEHDAVLHLFRVAASLDSLVVGETQILGQVKTAYQSAREAGLAGPTMQRLFDKTLSVAKRVRSSTRVGHASLSVASLAVEALDKALGGVEGRSLLVIGAGKMGEQALHKVRKLGAPVVFLANRTLQHACEEAQKHGAQAVEMQQIQSLLTTVDAVICSTSAPHIILSARQVARALACRGGRPLCLVDLAVPRDIDPEAALLSGVSLWDVDGLARAAAENQKLRREEAEQAERMVAALCSKWWENHSLQNAAEAVLA